MNAASRSSRPFDLILFGATGFTGRLVAQYLAGAKPEGLAWALAGRSRAKLEAVRSEIAAAHPSDRTLAALPLLVADSSDEAALADLAGKTRVVCTTVGPYAVHGRALIAACAGSGTDYCDLAGEVQFIRDAIDRLGTTAAQTGARLVPSCGFDSLPSDLGVYILGEHFAARGLRLARARLYVEKMGGGASGGTVASMLNIFEESSRDRSVLRLLADPYALDPDRGTSDDGTSNHKERGPDGRDQMGVRWDAEARRWSGPFVMAAINTRVVRRSNALRGYPFGRDFNYSEVMSFKPGVAGLIKAAGLSAGLGLVVAMAAASPTRKLLATRLPAPGEGPDQAAREAGSFRIRILGWSAPDEHGKVARAVALVEGHRDPAYGETSRMLGQAALCLAKDDLPRAGGVLTPSVAMGTKLVERLRGFGMTWNVESSPS